MNICERHSHAQRVWSEKIQGSNKLPALQRVAVWFAGINATIAEFFNPTLSSKYSNPTNKDVTVKRITGAVKSTDEFKQENDAINDAIRVVDESFAFLPDDAKNKNGAGHGQCVCRPDLSVSNAGIFVYNVNGWDASEWQKSFAILRS